MRSICAILLLTVAFTEAKKNKDADRHLEQALAKESATYIDEAIEMGAVTGPVLLSHRWRCTASALNQESLALCAGHQQEGSRWTDAAYGLSSAGQDQECGGTSQA